MLYEAKYKISSIFKSIKDSMECRDDVKGIDQITKLSAKVEAAMSQNDNLKKWDTFKNTSEYAEIDNEFASIVSDKYPELGYAHFLFQKPCFLNED